MDAEKVICCDRMGGSGIDTAALLNSGMNGQWNNPFIYLVWMMFAGRFFGNNGWGEGAQGENYNSRQIAALQETVNTNHNNDLAMQAINGNASAIAQLAQTMNCDFNTMQMAVCNVKSAIEQVSGQIGYSTESVKNAILMGDQNIMSKMSECCCNTQQNILKMGYENQLANERQTNVLQGSITDVRQTIVNGFANIGYQTAQQTCELKTNENANTQRIIDTLNNHWQAELQQKYQDARLELSQQAQNAYLISQLKTT